MNPNLKMLLLVLTMAGITYVIRMIPLTFFRKKITSTFLKSFLYYIPYAVLSAMTFPFVLYSTGNFWTALAGTVIAIIASMCKQSLLTVAIIACLSVLLFGFII
jgi:branched-subunit amino acid transport protein